MIRVGPALSLASFAVACGSVHRPELCVFRPAVGRNPASVEASSCPAARGPFTPGEKFYVLHELPVGARVDDSVAVTVASPCAGSSVTTKHGYSDRKALFSVVAPVGSDCSLTVTVQIMNETARFTSQPTSTDCQAQCPIVDSGAPDRKVDGGQ